MATSKALGTKTSRHREIHPAPVVDAAASALASGALASSDAALIQAAEEHPINIQRFNDEGDLDKSDSCPLWAAYERSKHLISAARPSTFQGLLAKPRAAKAEAAGPDGEESPEGTMAERWAFDIVNDLLRLYGTDA